MFTFFSLYWLHHGLVMEEPQSHILGSTDAGKTNYVLQSVFVDLLDHSHTHLFAFKIQLQNLIIAVETTWPTKLKIFIWQWHNIYYDACLQVGFYSGWFTKNVGCHTSITSHLNSNLTLPYLFSFKSSWLVSWGQRTSFGKVTTISTPTEMHGNSRKKKNEFQWWHREVFYFWLFG